MTVYSARRPVVVVTGFLGSGKTTLLNRALRTPALGDAAVLVNEFGAVGLDHEWLEAVDGHTVLLASGCVCCTIRDDLKAAVLELEDKRLRGLLPDFRRIVIETTGLADPAPVVATFLADLALRQRYRPAQVVTTVDALHGAATLDAHAEALRQVALADCLVLTKSDLAGAGEVDALRARLATINALAPLLDGARATAADLDALFGADLYRDEAREAEVLRWFATVDDAHPHSRHDHDIQAFCIERDGALDWSAFGVWLSLLLHRHGDRVLRVKGMLHVAGVAQPVVVNGVQHLVHPPVHLARWPDGRPRSRLVFIVQGLERAAIEESMAVFTSLTD